MKKANVIDCGSGENLLYDCARFKTYNRIESFRLNSSVYTRDFWHVFSEAMNESVSKDQTKDAYKSLTRENILIIGGVCSGKTSIIEKLRDVLPHKIIDIGKLFRIIAYIVINDNGQDAISPNIIKLREGDRGEMARVDVALSCKVNSIRSQFDRVKIFFENKKITAYLNESNIEKNLYTIPIEALAFVISKNIKMRKLLWKWMDLYTKNDPGNIITGYSLIDTDTTKYRIINLRVEKKEAAIRLMNSGLSNLTNLDEAYNFINNRNIRDGIAETENIIDRVYGSIIIDTTGFSCDEVKDILLEKLIEVSNERDVKQQEQKKKAICRKKFEWQVNPFIEIIRNLSEDIFEYIAQKYKNKGISEFDLGIQTMIHLAGIDMADALRGYKNGLKKESDLELTPIKLKKMNFEKEKIINGINRGRITLNRNLVMKEAKRQAMRLIELYDSVKVEVENKVVNLPAEYMGNIEANPFGTENSETTLTSGSGIAEQDIRGVSRYIFKEKNSKKKISIRKVSREISELYSKGFHYLHSFREDELISFGAFLENDDYPFAWVSYSPIDRNYKKEMLYHLGIESHRVLEMTRAWNAVWSPKNTMSTLFNFAHKQLINEWKDKAKIGEIDKPLAGIITSINGNLGFHASAFRGIGFKVVGLKPAKFNYLISEDKSIIYTTRRSMHKKFTVDKVPRIDEGLQCVSNKLPLLPTYEMVLLFDEKGDKELENRPIYLITKKSYKNI